MQPLLTPEQMAQADRATIAAGTSAETLMERAGRAVARAAIELMGARYGKRALVVCGKGNNGGDGFVAARILRAAGVAVDCIVMFDPNEASGPAAHHLQLMRRAGLDPDVFVLGKWEPGHGYDVAVDAIFGTGFRGTVEEGSDVAYMFEMLDYLPVVAVDIPSGVDGATGAVRGEAVRADVTVAIQAQKIGTALPPGSDRAGRVDVVDIGIELPRPVDAPSLSSVEPTDVLRWLPHRDLSAHKKSAGWVVVLAGSEEMRGAPLLTCRAAMRMGAGYVTLATTRSVHDAATSALPELLCRTASDADVLGPEALDRIAPLLERADAVAIGPGLGRGEAQSALVERVMQEVDLPLVLDADALNALEGRQDLIRDRARRGMPGREDALLVSVTVSTPHPAELARLLGTTTEAVVADRLSAAIDAARLGTVVVAKGHRSIVVDHGGEEASIVPVGGPELATAGTGDVLTGAVAARLAGGAWGAAAALVSTYVHGLAGEIAAVARGPEGVLASDVADALPVAVERLRRD